MESKVFLSCQLCGNKYTTQPRLDNHAVNCENRMKEQEQKKKLKEEKRLRKQQEEEENRKLKEERKREKKQRKEEEKQKQAEERAEQRRLEKEARQAELEEKKKQKEDEKAEKLRLKKEAEEEAEREKKKREAEEEAEREKKKREVEEEAERKRMEKERKAEEKRRQKEERRKPIACQYCGQEMPGYNLPSHEPKCKQKYEERKEEEEEIRRATYKNRGILLLPDGQIALDVYDDHGLKIVRRMGWIVHEKKIVGRKRDMMFIVELSDEDIVSLEKDGLPYEKYKAEQLSFLRHEAKLAYNEHLKKIGKYVEPDALPSLDMLTYYPDPLTEKELENEREGWPRSISNFDWDRDKKRKAYERIIYGGLTLDEFEDKIFNRNKLFLLRKKIQFIE